MGQGLSRLHLAIHHQLELPIVVARKIASWLTRSTSDVTLAFQNLFRNCITSRDR
jgi:hypothetical protein